MQVFSESFAGIEAFQGFGEIFLCVGGEFWGIDYPGVAGESGVEAADPVGPV